METSFLAFPWAQLQTDASASSFLTSAPLVFSAGSHFPSIPVPSVRSWTMQPFESKAWRFLPAAACGLLLALHCSLVLTAPHHGSPMACKEAFAVGQSLHTPLHCNRTRKGKWMYFIIETYAVSEGQVSKVRFDAGAMDVAPGRHSTGASSAGPAWYMSRTTILATPAPALPAALQAEGLQCHPAGEADGACGVTQSITFYMQKPTELHRSSSSILKSRGCLPPQSSYPPVMPPSACVEVLMNRLVVFHRYK